MLTDSKPKVPRLREILLPEFVLLHFQTALEDFFGFRASDCDVHGDFLVAADAECADCVAGFTYKKRGRKRSEISKVLRKGGKGMWGVGNGD